MTYVILIVQAREVLAIRDGKRTLQTIALPIEKLTGTLRLTILETYKGSKYNDTCISEVIFG